MCVSLDHKNAGFSERCVTCMVQRSNLHCILTYLCTDSFAHVGRYSGLRVFPDSRGPRELDPTPPPSSGGDQDQFFSTAYYFDRRQFFGNAYRCVCVCVCVRARARVRTST